MSVYTIERGRWLIEFHEDWSQFFERCNWYTFRFVQLEVEDDRHLGGLEFVITLLGVGLRVRWNHTETEDMKEIMRRLDEIEDERQG